MIDNESKVLDAIEGLKRINDELILVSTCYKKQQELISKLLNHDKIGQTTYRVSGYEVVVKKSNRMSLDIDKYHEHRDLIPEGYDPVRIRQKTTYDIDKKLYDRSQDELCVSQSFLINQFITITPAPLSVTVKKVVA